MSYSWEFELGSKGVSRKFPKSPEEGGPSGFKGVLFQGVSGAFKGVPT